jgi:hypothetical protein
MRLTDIQRKIKGIPDIPRDLFIFLLIALIGCGMFFATQIINREVARKGELRIIQSESIAQPANLNADNESTTSNQGINSTTTIAARGMYVGSHSGSYYYLPTCAGARRIKDKNKIWFTNKADAESKGYKPANNCSTLTN